MTDVLVEATQGYIGLGRGRNRAVFRNPRGNKYWYCFYQDLSGQNIEYEYSTNGTSWSNTPQTVSSYAVGDFDVKIYDSGTSLQVWVVWYETSTNNLVYRNGAITDSGTTITWNDAQTIDTLSHQISGGGSHSVALARTDNGRIVVTFTEDVKVTGKYYRQTKIIGSDGDGASPSWSGETTLDDPSGNTDNKDKDDIWFGMESFSSSYPNRVVIFGRVPNQITTTAYELYGWVYDWNGSSMSEIAWYDETPGDLTASYISLIITDEDKVHIIFVCHNIFEDYYFHHRYFATAGGLGSSSYATLTTATIDACTLCIDRTNDDLYAFYHHSADTNTYHYKKTAISTISWGSEQDITTSDTMEIWLNSYSSDVESYLHLAFRDDDGDIYYDSLSLAADITGYKDVTLKTSLESAITYKDVVFKTTFESIPTYKDLILKTSLHSLDYKDIVLKTTLESALTYKDITVKTTFDSLDYKDIVLKTTLDALIYKDIAIKTSFESEETTAYKDITLKTTLESALTYKDIVLKTTFESIPIYKDIILKTTFDALTYKDIALKTSLEAEAITGYKDITLKTTLESALTYKDIIIKTTFDLLEYKDIILKTTLDSLSYKDIALKTSLETGEITGYKDVILKITLDSLEYKDIVMKTSLESVFIYKDINLKITLDSLDYKDISLKVSLYSTVLPTEIINLISPIHQTEELISSIHQTEEFISSIHITEDLTSSISQTEDLISSITQTKNFISKLNS